VPVVSVRTTADPPEAGQVDGTRPGESARGDEVAAESRMPAEVHSKQRHTAYRQREYPEHAQAVRQARPDQQARNDDEERGGRAGGDVRDPGAEDALIGGHQAWSGCGRFHA
jgi:hypothetical protein